VLSEGTYMFVISYLEDLFTLWLYLQARSNRMHAIYDQQMTGTSKTDTKNSVTYKLQVPAVSITTHPHDTHDYHTG